MKHEISLSPKTPGDGSCMEGRRGSTHQPTTAPDGEYTRAHTVKTKEKKKNIPANNCGSIEVKKQIIQNAGVKNGGAAHQVAC